MRLNKGQITAYPFVKAALGRGDKVIWVKCGDDGDPDLDLDLAAENGISVENNPLIAQCRLCDFVSCFVNGAAQVPNDAALIILDLGYYPADMNPSWMVKMLQRLQDGTPALVFGGRPTKKNWKMVGGHYKANYMLRPFMELGVDNEETAMQLKAEYGGEIKESIVFDLDAV